MGAMAFCLREKRTLRFPKGLSVASHFLKVWPLMVVFYKHELLLTYLGKRPFANFDLDPDM